MTPSDLPTYMSARYRKKPVVVDAWQLTRAVIEANILDKTPLPGPGLKLTAHGCHPARREVHHHRYIVHTSEGAMRADEGDWIICGVKGEFYPCKPDIFEASYESALLDRDEGGSLREAKCDMAHMLAEGLATVLGTATHGQNMTWESRIKIGRDILDLYAASLSPAQRTSLPLPDRERTDTDIVDKREDRSARDLALEEAARICEQHQRFFTKASEDRYDEGAGIALWTAATAIRAIASEPRAADITSPTPPDALVAALEEALAFLRSPARVTPSQRIENAKITLVAALQAKP